MSSSPWGCKRDTTEWLTLLLSTTSVKLPKTHMVESQSEEGMVRVESSEDSWPSSAWHTVGALGILRTKESSPVTQLLKDKACLDPSIWVVRVVSRPLEFSAEPCSGWREVGGQAHCLYLIPTSSCNSLSTPRPRYHR